MHKRGTLAGTFLERRTGHSCSLLVRPGTYSTCPCLIDPVSAMSHSLLVPTSTKIRLCPSSTPTATTATFGRLLEHAGASWLTLHARHVSAKRRRQGAADLDAVRAMKQALSIPIVSNGNVRTFGDVRANLEYTQADGAMVGETLLGNPMFVFSVR